MASAIVVWSILGAAVGALTGSVKAVVPEEAPQCKVGCSQKYSVRTWWHNGSNWVEEINPDKVLDITGVAQTGGSCRCVGVNCEEDPSQPTCNSGCTIKPVNAGLQHSRACDWTAAGYPNNCTPWLAVPQVAVYSQLTCGSHTYRYIEFALGNNPASGSAKLRVLIECGCFACDGTCP